jgi:Ribbon-helix-helix protein, copG family
MSKRLQVLLPDSEMEEIQRMARRERVTVGEWTRRALRMVRAHQPLNDPQVKIKAIRKAADYSFPTADIQYMLAEIERGYRE